MIDLIGNKVNLLYVTVESKKHIITIQEKEGGGRCLQEANHQDSIARYSISPVKKPIEVDYIP